MKILKEVKFEEINPHTNLKTRTAARAILFDECNLIPLLFVSKQNYHKLPGGGVENGESKEEALVREVLEEVGSEIKITSEIGQTIEYIGKYSLKQTSYCYFGKIVSKGKPKFTEKEIENGFKLVWMSLGEAISTMENEEPNDYRGRFIKERDLTFLREAKRLIEGKI